MKSKLLTTITTAVVFAASGHLFGETPANTDGVAPPAAAAEPIAEKEAIAPGTLGDAIQDSVTFATLTQALKASGLDVTLGQNGSYTIFAPTDEAFGKLPAGTLDKLLLPENKEKLRSLLLYHVVAGRMMTADFKDGDIKTMNGEKLEIDVENDEIEVGDTKLFGSEVVTSNGIMHSVGQVLVPESLDDFAGLED